MDVAEWQKRLEDNFTANGIVGGYLSDIFEQEKACGHYFITTFHGQSVLIKSFQSFYIETIRAALRWVGAHGWPTGYDNYAPILMYFVIMFRSFRACESLLLKGYPLDGYALLRGLKDRAIFLGAIAHNITTLPGIYGYGGFRGITDKDRKRRKKERKEEEYRVLKRMIRESSGLPKDVVEQLRKWEELFHQEVHGSKLSFATELGNWVRGEVPLSIGPLPEESSMAMYMNRACEVAWLMTRLLPYLQAEENAFGDEWSERHGILDESFRYMQQGLSALRKKIGDAFIAFVDQKFSFKKPFFYFEADGTA